MTKENFDLLFVKHYPELVESASGIGGKNPEDLLHDCYLRCIKRLPKDKEVNKGWIFFLLYTEMIDQMRVKKRRPLSYAEELEESMAGLAEHSYDAREDLDGALGDKVLSAIDELNEILKTTFLHRHVSGMKPAEVAEILCIERANVNTRTSMACEILRTKLKEYANENYQISYQRPKRQRKTNAA